MNTLPAIKTAGRAAIFVAAVLLLTIVGPNPAHAAAIAVTTTNDEINTDGDCSLREAIQAANTDTDVDACLAGSGADTITAPAGTYTLAIPGLEDSNASGDLDIEGDLTINGAGAAVTIIDGGSIDRVFEVHGGANVTINNVTVVNGSSGAGNDGGGIRNAGTLAVNTSVIDGNSAGNSLADGNGASGGGIFNSGTLTLTNTAISGNTALVGGGLRNAGGNVTVNRSTVSNNVASGYASAGLDGGISNWGTMTIQNSTVSGNRANDAGANGVNNWGTLTIENSTVHGGDIEWNGTTTSIWGDVMSSGTTTIANTIFDIGFHLDPDCAGSSGITSAGNNLISMWVGCPFSAASGDLVGSTSSPIDLKLGPLQDNGGPTWSHALLPGGPAIDQGTCSDLGGNPVATDQRGVGRPKGAGCDIGAFELIPPALVPGASILALVAAAVAFVALAYSKLRRRVHAARGVLR